MNFQNIAPVPKYREILGGAIRNSKKQTKEPRSKLLTTHIEKKLSLVIRDFPSFDSMNDFYREAIAQVVDVAKAKKALSSINWAIDKIKQFSKETDLQGYKQNLGRISSIMKRIAPHLELLDDVRKALKDLPDIKKLFTVCIAGFPNVGKSTLLSRITSSKPEIKDYAFTTKRLNTGYFEFRLRKIQVIDTPGTLARFDKMNKIERLAFLALKYKSDIIVFVLDPTGNLQRQKDLYSQIRKYGDEIIAYISKSDICSPENVINASKELGIEEYFTNPEKLKRKIISLI